VTLYSKPTVCTGDDIRLNGITFNTISEDECIWIITDLDGWWGLPDPELEDDTRPSSEEGSYDVTGRYSGRNITLAGYIVPTAFEKTDVNAVVVARRALNRALQLVRSVGVLSVDEADGTKTSAVQVVGRPLTRFNNLNNTLEFNVQLRASDPRKYSPDELMTTVTLTWLANLRMYPRDYTWTYAPWTTQEMVVVNDGSADADFTLSFSGLVVNPKITHLESGSVLELDANIPSGSVVYLNTLNQTVLLNNRTPLKRALARGSEWFKLVPGENHLTVEGRVPLEASPQVLENRTNGVRNPKPVGTLAGFGNFVVGSSAYFPEAGTTFAVTDTPTEIEVRRNLSRNSAMSFTTGLTTLRTNLSSRPTAETFSSTAGIFGVMTTRGFGTGGAGTYSIYSPIDAEAPNYGTLTVAQKTWTTAPSSMANSVGTGFNLTQTGLNAVPIGGIVPISVVVDVRTSVTRNVHIEMIFYDAAGAVVNTYNTNGVDSSTTVPANTWTEVRAITTSGFGATRVAVIVDSSASTAGGAVNWAVGSTMWVTNFLIETGSYSYQGPYFNGDYSPDPELTDIKPVSWLGTPHASKSVMQAEMPMEHTAFSNGISDTPVRLLADDVTWKYTDGSPRPTVIPMLDTGTQGFSNSAGVAINGENTTNFTNTLLVPGHTYVVRATILMNQAQPGETWLSDEARRIVVRYNTVTGLAGHTRVMSTQAANTPGVTDLFVVVTIPTSAVWGMVTLMNGSGGILAPSVPVWWTDVLIQDITNETVPTAAPPYWGNYRNPYPDVLESLPDTYVFHAYPEFSTEYSRVLTSTFSFPSDNFARRVTTRQKNLLDTSSSGWYATSTSGDRALITSGGAAEPLQFSAYVRYGGTKYPTMKLTIYLYSGSTVVATLAAPDVQLTPGEWQRLFFSTTTNTAYTSVGWSLEEKTGDPLEVMSNLDMRDILIEKSYADLGYFDGDNSFASWSGTANASTSTMTAHDAITEAVVQLRYNNAWIE
jgi:hypothetical protein